MRDYSQEQLKETSFRQERFDDCSEDSQLENEESKLSEYERKEADSDLGNNKENGKLQQIIETMEAISKTKTKRAAHMNYHLRKDVITKTIFRAARKYFIRRFKSFFDFTKVSKLDNEELQRKIREKVKVYLRMLFGESASAAQNAVFIAILDPKGIQIALEAEGEEFRDLVYNLLFKFNKFNMEQLMLRPEFIKLISVFLNEPSVVRMIVKSRRDKSTEKVYQRQ